jgi:asparagine synthase (glutamine-hydrolysing)
LENILLESFKLRMVSDVEVGMFLSGGIDSSTVAGLLTKKLGYSNLKTFTIGFEERGYNEAGYAQKIAQYLGTDHHEFYCSIREALNVIPKLADIYDEPFGDSSAIPTYLLAQFARGFVKVSLSADGGDETFAGYDRYMAIEKIYKQFQLYPKSVLRIGAKLFQGLPIDKVVGAYQNLMGASAGATKLKKQLGKLKRKADRLDNLITHPRDILSFYQLLGYGFWKYHEVRELLREGEAMDSFDYLQGMLENPSLRSLTNISQMQLMDYKTYMADDILVKVDRATMAWGLEGRDPLLDHKIIEYVAGLPVSFKYQKGITKYLLRQILYKYVPKEYLERPKQGFSIPLAEWLRSDLKFLLDDYLSEGRIKTEGIFNWEIIKLEKEKFLQYKMDYTDHLWLLIVFEMWAERWYH